MVVWTLFSSRISAIVQIHVILVIVKVRTIVSFWGSYEEVFKWSERYSACISSLYSHPSGNHIARRPVAILFFWIVCVHWLPKIPRLYSLCLNAKEETTFIREKTTNSFFWEVFRMWIPCEARFWKFIRMRSARCVFSALHYSLLPVAITCIMLTQSWERRSSIRFLTKTIYHDLCLVCPSRLRSVVRPSDNFCMLHFSAFACVAAPVQFHCPACYCVCWCALLHT